MPGLINQSSRCPLLLTASEVTSCVSGYALGMTASLTYCNLQAQPCKGLFIFPLDEGTTVVGFEAVICQRAVTVQIKDKAKIDDVYLDSISLPDGGAPSGGGRIVMDEDLERIAFVANLGTIPPLESVSIFISTSSELQTLPSGAVRVLLPAVCVPRVPQPNLENTSSLSSHQLSMDKQCCASGSPELGSSFCLAQLLQSEATNPSEYEFSFHLEIRGPCLLAGVESPTHEIRADADPSACSAKSIVITLANRHTFDRPVEILIHPSEPHKPHILMEEGDMTPAEYEQHLKGKNDFIKGTKKDPSAEKKTEIIRKRLHKDIPHHPVLMLNFCPELSTTPADLQKAAGEFIFLVDCSGSSTSIRRAKDALLVALKSLMPACLFNIITFSSTFKILFPASRTYCEESLAVACESIRRMHADTGSPNILSPLKWIVRQPIRRGHPRLLFLLSHRAVGSTGMVLELLRNHACSTRCYSFGIGPHACRRLVQGAAAVSRGVAEFLVGGERLQPKVIRSLKKAMAPVLSDVSVEWVFPESTEVLVSPLNTSCLFPGDRLVGYSIICDTSLYISKPRADKRRRYSTMRSQESGSSVFFHSQEEGTGAESWNYPEGCSTPDQLAAGRDPSGESDTDAGQAPVFLTSFHLCSANFPPGFECRLLFSSALLLLCFEPSRAEYVLILLERTDADPFSPHSDVKASCRRRAYSANQISDRQPLYKEPTASDPGSALLRNPLRKTQLQDLQQLSPELQPVHFQPFTATPRISTTWICGAGARRPSLLQQSHVSSCHCPTSPPAPDVAVGWGSGLLDASLQSSSDSRSPGEPEAAQHPSFTFETETSSDWELQDWDSGATRGSPRSPRASCKAVVKGLRGGEPMQWEITFDLPALLREQNGQEEGKEDVWSETFHQLAARAVIRDLELLAERECDIEHGPGRRYQLNAIHTSKACNVISKYTAFVPVELSSGTYLPPIIEYSHTGALSKQGDHRSLSSGRRRCRGLSSAQPLSPCGQNGDDGFYGMDMDEPRLSPCSTPLSSSWKRCRIPEVPFQSLSAPSTRSPKSIESIFAARLTLQKTRLLTRAAKGFMSKSPGRASEASSESDGESTDYLPLVSLQLACGAFLMNSAFCKAVSIPMEKLCWTSPFSCHRLALSPSSSSSTKRPEQRGSPVHSRQLLIPSSSSAWDTGGAMESISKALKAESELSPPAITIRHSPAERWDASISEAESTDVQMLLLDIELQKQTEPEGMLWATAVALAWLEHSSASHFTEWELVAAKASLWLGEQDFSQGCSLAAVKSAAQQLFVLLRHWDENLEFNLLCYNPGSV
ncbi:von Willebrand factor A domain-containing protein 5B1 [Phasianus colchicus]|uniref:von Willebrand factor A domain-containing protein 5B1 n=1 Tax=Phasianus colchicus TaxID=9054 RepID=UPI00129EAFAF|nr:von Willebrand factor A domain-containing protein 5B1 [Phasianus colchicus]